MHSEDIDDHKLASRTIQNPLRQFEDRPIAVAKMEFTNEFLLDHARVLEQFGRYPYCNTKLGRTSTPEEIAWLEDRDNLPSWAKSQG